MNYKKHNQIQSGIENTIKKIILQTKASQQQTLQSRLYFIFEKPHSTVNFLLDIINGFLSLLMVASYIYSTYQQGITFFGDWQYNMSLIGHIYFLLEFSARCYATQDLMKLITSQESIIDIITILPYFIVLVTQSSNPHSYDNIIFNEDNIYQHLAELFILVRLVRFQKYALHIESDNQKELFKITIQVISLVVVAAAATQFVQQLSSLQPNQNDTIVQENNQQYTTSYKDNNQAKKVFDYHYHMFFIFTTISTVGYENKLDTPLARVVIIILLLFAIIFVPSKSGQMISLLSSKSQYARQCYTAVQSIPHVVVTGIFSLQATEDYIHELFHEDHGQQTVHALLLIPQAPQAQNDGLLSNMNIIFLEGDPLNEKDLKRCSIENAKAVAILCNKHTSDPQKEDAKTILIAMVIKRYLDSLQKNSSTIQLVNNQESSLHLESNQQDKIKRQNTNLRRQQQIVGSKLQTMKTIGAKNALANKNNYNNQMLISKNHVRFCIQLLQQEGRMHYLLSMNRESSHDQIICVEELKLSLLAQSCLCPGLITVISNLIASISNNNQKSIPQQQNEENFNNQSGFFGKRQNSLSQIFRPHHQQMIPQWLEEYQKGQEYEIYKTNLSKRFQGIDFAEVVLIIYNNFHAVLFAVEISAVALNNQAPSSGNLGAGSFQNNNQSQIYMNPRNLEIPRDRKVMGYVIAEDRKIVDEIANYRSEHQDVEKILDMRRPALKFEQSRERMQPVTEQEQEMNSPNTNGSHKRGNKFQQITKVIKNAYDRTYNMLIKPGFTNKQNQQIIQNNKVSDPAAQISKKTISNQQLNNMSNLKEVDNNLEVHNNANNIQQSSFNSIGSINKDRQNEMQRMETLPVVQNGLIQEDSHDYLSSSSSSDSESNSDETLADGNQYKQLNKQGYLSNNIITQTNKNKKYDGFKNFLTGEWSRIVENCHLSKVKVNLSEVTAISYEHNILVKNHILLCGIVPNLLYFIVPLRAKSLSQFYPILILNETPPTEKQWNQISLFPEIYFKQGSALVEQDLIKSNIAQAYKVVILSPQTNEIGLIAQNQQNFQRKRRQNNNNGGGVGNEGGNSSTNQQQAEEIQDQQESQNNSLLYSKATKELTKDEENLLDARTIFKYKAVKKLRPDIQVFSEFVNIQNLEFLITNHQDFRIMKRYGHKNTPIFASGEIYSSSIMDSLCCQAFYNQALVIVLNHLLLPSTSQMNGNQENRTTDQQKNTVYHLGKKHNNQNQEESEYGKNSSLFQICVPPAFIDKHYRTLFNFLIKKKNIISLSLYRMPRVLDNRLPYVQTNPEPNLILKKNDMILILSQELPDEKLIRNWGTPLDDENNINDTISQNIDLQQQQKQVQNEENLYLNFEDFVHGNTKMKQQMKEQEFLNEKINNIIENLNDLKSETSELINRIAYRQEHLMEQIQEIFKEEVKQLITYNNGQSMQNGSPIKN